MKKILGLLLATVLVCSCSDTIKNEGFVAPDQKNDKDWNSRDLVYPVKTFMSRNNACCTAFMYIVNGDTIIINSEGGILKY